MCKFFLVVLSIVFFVIPEKVEAEPYFYISPFYSASLSPKQVRKLKKDQKKRARKVKKEEDFKEAAEALKNRDWVLMANKLYSHTGKTFNIHENSNCFIQLKEEVAYIQLCLNGISTNDQTSGITLQGYPYNFDSESDKYGNVKYTFDVDGHNLSVQVKISINYNDNYAQVTVTPYMNRKCITFSGWLLPREKASFYTSGYLNY